MMVCAVRSLPGLPFSIAVVVRRKRRVDGQLRPLRIDTQFVQEVLRPGKTEASFRLRPLLSDDKGCPSSQFTLRHLLLCRMVKTCVEQSPSPNRRRHGSLEPLYLLDFSQFNDGNDNKDSDN